jgi:hypothetical protein
MSQSTSFNNSAAAKPAAPTYPVTLNNVTLDDIEKVGARGTGLFRIYASVASMDPQTPRATLAFFAANRVIADIFYKEDSLKKRSSLFVPDNRLRPLVLDELKFNGTMNGMPAGAMGKMRLNGVMIETNPSMICHVGPSIQVSGQIVDIDARWNAHNESVLSALGLTIVVETPLKKDQILKNHFFDSVSVAPPDGNGRLIAKDLRKPEQVPGNASYLDHVWKTTRDIALSDL